MEGETVSDSLMPSRGSSFPLGASVQLGGVNFSVFSKGSEAVELLLVRGIKDARPDRASPWAARSTDINDWLNAPPVDTDVYPLGSRSVVFFVGNTGLNPE